jgi:magnesium-transporting ATPase (P-type)
MKNINLNFKNILKKKERTQNQSALNPHRHWRVLLEVFFGAVILLVFFSLFLLYQIKNDQIFQASPTIQDSNPSIKQDLLKKVDDSFTQKALKEKELKENPPIYRDPSL